MRFTTGHFSIVFQRGVRALGLIACTCLLILGCDKSQTNAPPGMSGGPGGPGGPTEVSVISVVPQTVTLTQDLLGRVTAFRTAAVLARVDGIVQKRLFTEGSEVKEGQVLYQIDSSSYDASLNSAKGTLAKAQANADGARAKVKRYEDILSTKAISQQDYDDARATLKACEADVLFGKAAVESAQITLGYTTVTSPISGRIGKSAVTEGAYVQASGATLLATVQQLDQVYVDVTQSTVELLRLRRAVANGEIQTDSSGRARVLLLLEDGSEYAEEGKIEFADVTVSMSTSSVTIRAIFPNPHNELLPGLFVRARLVEGQKKDAILVPQSAVMRNTKGEPFAFVASDKGIVEQRILGLSRTIGNQWLVQSGLNAGDQLIIDNLQRIHNGTAVKMIPAHVAVSDAMIPER